MRSRALVVAALGTSQTLAWGSSYYLPAILARPMAATFGIPPSWVFGAFSASLLLGAMAGPTIGRTIDRHGGRGVLVLSNLVLAVGLVALAMARGPVWLFAAWAVLGLGMALGLYDAAFAALTALYGTEARGPITGITLIAGFASTVSWPLTAWLEASYGWRDACLVWALLHAVIGLPLNGLVLPRGATTQWHGSDSPPAGWTPVREMTLMAFVFAAAGFVTGAMAAHLPALLERAGATRVQAIAASALLGPAQVAARIAEFLILRRAHPLISSRVAVSLHPLGALVLTLLGSAASAPFVVLHGAGNGLVTIARGTLPLALLGPRGYGARTGLLAAPSRMALACAPLAFGLLLDAMGATAIFVSALLSALALGALMRLHVTPDDANA